MKLSTSITAFLLSTVATARSGWFSGDQQHPLTAVDKEPFPVTGDSPLRYCTNPSNYTLEITKLDISPNPPLAGHNLTIKAHGTLSHPVEEGAKVHLTVKYGFISIINQEVDLCEQVANINMSCPVEKGAVKLDHTVELPKEIPPGKYTVLADVMTKAGGNITCLTASVAFHLPKLGNA